MLQPILALASLIAVAPSTQGAGPPALTPLASAIDAAATRSIRERYVPGGAVAVIEGGEVTLLRGYGVADSHSGRAVTPSTIFQIGSISKTVAAWGVMRLVETGRLDLDAPIGTVVERWSLPESEFEASGVTIRRLLSHTGGLSVHGYAGFGPDEVLPTIEASLAGAEQSETAVRLVSEPGSQWSYSGGGYTLLQLAIEETSGQSFSDFMTREVLAPLGMSSSRYGEPVEPARFASAHGGYGEPADSPRFTALAAAGIHTTLEDMVLFVQASLTAEAKPLSRTSIRAMQTPVAVGGGTYGLGYQCGLIGDRSWVGHGGSNRVWLADMRLIPETGDGLLVFTNSASGDRMLQEVVQAWIAQVGGEAPTRRNKKRSVTVEIEPLLRTEGIEAAKERYAELRKNHRREYTFGTVEFVALGLYLIRTGKPEEGLATLRWAVELKPKRHHYLQVLADTYDRLGKREEALAAWRAAAERGNKAAKRRLDAID